MKHNYDDENLEDYVNTSMSYAQVLRKMGITPAGGNYSTLKQKIKDRNIDTSHFTGKGWNIGLKFIPRKAKPLEEILQINSPYSSHQLKKRLIKEGLKKHQCESCLRTEWMDKPIPIELEHINGDHHDNRIENLLILCPNCHAQTEHYRGRAVKTSTKYEYQRRFKDPKYCLDCHKIIDDKATRCKSCAGKLQSTKIDWPSIEELKQRIENASYAFVAKQLGVSDNAVRKRIKNHS